MRVIPCTCYFRLYRSGIPDMFPFSDFCFRFRFRFPLSVFHFYPFTSFRKIKKQKILKVREQKDAESIVQEGSG